MSSVNTRKDTTTADILNQLRQDIAKNKAKNTASNNFVITHLIPQDDSIAITDSITQPTALGIIFKCTNDAGGGVTVGQEGIISQSIMTEPNGGQIAAETADGYGAGVHQPGLIETTELM